MTKRDQRIEILKDILLKLHHGASPEAVQADFNQHFSGVSAIEISLMEHELMSGDHGISFEDVMKLCNVHANLFRDKVDGEFLDEMDQPGHPIRIFKDENLALQACLIRVGRLLDQLVADPDLLQEDGIRQGLLRQVDLLSQFDAHYRRKEHVFFPQLERHGHTAPPKVMWGVDDQIRDLFKTFRCGLEELQADQLAAVQTDFRAFEDEFKEMIFKEEQILVNIMIEALDPADWRQIVADSATYGYAIIRPQGEWPQIVESDASAAPAAEGKEEPASAEAILASDAKKDSSARATAEGTSGTVAGDVNSMPVSAASQFQQTIDLGNGRLHIQYEATPNGNGSQTIDADTVIPLTQGNLTQGQLDLMLQHLPLEISFVDKDNIFRYYNDAGEGAAMIFPRTPGQVGRNIEYCHPPRVVDRVMSIVDALRSGEQDQEVMWFPMGDRFVYVTYHAVRDADGQFQGILETVQDIQPFRDLPTDRRR